MTLPAPINGTETYLAAVYHRLGEVLERLPARPEPASDGTVELREPAQAKPAEADNPVGVELTEPKTDTAEDEDPVSAGTARPRRKSTRSRKGST